MKYVLLTITLLALALGIWVVVDRADKAAQEIVSICNDRYEKDTKSNQTHNVDNSENVRTKERCLAGAYEHAEFAIRADITAIVVGTIISLILYVARRKASI